MCRARIVFSQSDDIKIGAKIVHARTKTTQKLRKLNFQLNMKHVCFLSQIPILFSNFLFRQHALADMFLDIIDFSTRILSKI